MGLIDTMLILSSDIGGTNSRFAVFEVHNFDLKLIESVWLKSSEVGSFKDLLTSLTMTSLSPYLSRIESCVIAAAGPVEKGEVCSPPNIPWKIFKSDLNLFFPNSENFIINDFLAQAYSSISKCGLEATVVKSGIKLDGSIAVIGAGTGLGKAYLNFVNAQYVGFPSEGGHAPFSPNSDVEYEYLKFLKAKLNREDISWEEVSAGRSFSYMYEFFYKKVGSPSEVSSLIKSKEVPLVVEMYAGTMGRICMAFALEVLATAGIYIAGGVLAKNKDILEHPRFQAEFLNSSTQKGLLTQIPIYLIDNEDSGLWGGAQFVLGHI